LGGNFLKLKATKETDLHQSALLVVELCHAIQDEAGRSVKMIGLLQE
jgi:hypothetical protein